MSSSTILIAESGKHSASPKICVAAVTICTVLGIALSNGTTATVGTPCSPTAQCVCAHQTQGIQTISPDYNGITISLYGSGSMLKVNKSIERLRSFEKYPFGWDGYSASTFSHEFIEYAIDIVKGLPTQPEIYPLSDGRVQFEYSKKTGEYLEFELNTDLTANVFCIKSDLSEKEFVDCSDSLPKIVREFYEC